VSGLSRRGFLYGAAGVAAAAALTPSQIARAAVTPAARAAATPLTGAITTPGTYQVKGALQAAKIADGYIGLPLAVTMQKFWVEEAALGEPTPTRLKELSAAGCQFLISVQPSQQQSAAEQSQLASWLTMVKNDGISFRAVLWAECNDGPFATAKDWLAYWQYYAPVIQDAGVSCGYDPSCGYKPETALQYFPSNPVPDELWMDYYATGFRRGSRLDELLAMAHSAGLATAGLGEWGWEAGDPALTPMTIPWWNEYCEYLIYMADHGHFGLGANYWGARYGSYTCNIIYNASDPRIPMIQKVSQAIAAR
jgi:hypothetical protein